MTINYQKLLDEAMLSLVKKVLIQTQKSGLEGNYLYISFRTQDKSVVLSERMKKRYPQQIMIILQHQFDNLVVEENSFSVGLSFDGVYERIKVPFHTIIEFADPSVQLSIQFISPEKLKLEMEEKIARQSSHIEQLNPSLLAAKTIKQKITEQKQQRGSIHNLTTQVKSSRKIHNPKLKTKKSELFSKEVDAAEGEDLPSNVIMLDKFRNKE